MAVLLDTNVVSELSKPRPHPNIAVFLAKQPPASVFLSTITLAEISYGILMSQEPRKQVLQAWLDREVRVIFSGCILTVTESTILQWRILVEQGRKAGRTYSQPDLFLAATALEHQLTLVTRNTRDFTEIPGLSLHNPWT